MSPLLLRYVATLTVVLAVSGFGGQVMGEKNPKEDVGADDDAEDHQDQDQDQGLGDGVLALTADSFEQAVTSLPLLVYYYAKWCKHCVTTGPMIDALAVLLRDRDDLALRVAKVDVETETELVKEHGVSGFPTIRMYKDGRQDDFYGDRSVPNLVQWLERKMGLGVHTISSVKQARQLFAAHPSVTVGFFKDAESEEAAVFKAASTHMDKTVFALVDDEKLMAELKAEDGTVVVFKKFDEGRADVTLTHTEDSLIKALKRSTRPLVSDYRSDESQDHFTARGTGNRTVLVVFLSRRAGHYELLRDALQPVALQHVNEVVFLTVNVDDADSGVVLDAFGLSNATAMPVMRIYRFADGQRYEPTTDRMNTDAVRDFVAGVLSGAIQPRDAAATAAAVGKGADLVENGVKVLTTANFEQEVYDGRRHALVMFYTETCPHCTTFKPIFEEVASKLADEQSLVMAKINMGVGRPKSTGIDIIGVPYVVLYPRTGKDKPVLFDGTRNAKALLKFLKKHTALEGKKSRAAKGKAADKDRDEL